MVLGFLLPGFSLSCLFPPALGSPFLGNSLALLLTLGFVLLVAAVADLAADSMLNQMVQLLVLENREEAFALFAVHRSAVEHTLHHLALRQSLGLANAFLLGVDGPPNGVAALGNSTSALFLLVLLGSLCDHNSLLGFDDPAPHSAFVLDCAVVLSVD